MRSHSAPSKALLQKSALTGGDYRKNCQRKLRSTDERPAWYIAWRPVAFFVVLLACLPLLGCAFTDGTIDGRYDSINRSTDSARNQAILINIIRASKAEPLNFVAFSKVGGTTSTSMGVGLPSFIVGPDRLPNQKQVTLGNNTLNGSVSASSNFDIAILENRDFYTALLTPVDDETLNFFERQGYPRELLFWLFADSVRATGANGKAVEFRNEPTPEKSCELSVGPSGQPRCFIDYVDAAIYSGFRVETRQIEKSVTSSDGKTKLVPKTEARTCFDPVLADRAWQELNAGRRHRRPSLGLGGVSPICGKWPPSSTKTAGGTRGGGGAGGMSSNDAAPRPDNKLIVGAYGPAARRSASPSTGGGAPVTPSSAPRIELEISPRSTYGIYQYLGRILAENAMTSVRLDTDGKDDAQILTIIEGGAGPCFAEADYEGKHYCVPTEGAENTKRIIGLLAQLLALKTPQTDLPFTPTVRVTP